MNKQELYKGFERAVMELHQRGKRAKEIWVSPDLMKVLHGGEGYIYRPTVRMWGFHAIPLHLSEYEYTGLPILVRPDAPDYTVEVH